MNYFSIDQLPHVAWKNGGGTTREIMCWPAGADLFSFDWRVSVATIAVAGPFSRFEGIDRVIMLLDGDGVVLQGSNTDHRLEQHNRPFAFSGDEHITSRLLGGASTDFNVMTRRSQAHAQVSVLASSITLEQQPAGLVMCLSGCWKVDQHAIHQGQGYWWSSAIKHVALETCSSQRAELVLVTWTRR